MLNHHGILTDNLPVSIKPEDVIYRISLDGSIVPVIPPNYPIAYKLNPFVYQEIISKIFKLSNMPGEGYIRNPIVVNEIVMFELLNPSKLDFAAIEQVKQKLPNLVIKFSAGIFV